MPFHFYDTKYTMARLSVGKTNISYELFNSDSLQSMSFHYSDIITSPMTYQITGVSMVYSTVCSGEDQRKHQSSVSLAFVRGIHWSPVNSPHKRTVTRKVFSIDDVIMWTSGHRRILSFQDIINKYSFARVCVFAMHPTQNFLRYLCLLDFEE